MLTLRALTQSFQELGIRDVPVIAHASYNSLGGVEGGPQTVVDAMLASFASVIMPTHTYKTMVTPQVGPQHNGIDYARWYPHSFGAEFFDPEMPADPLMGIIPETLRRQPGAKRSMHPILSFSGVCADDILATQTIDNPFAPIRKLVELDGWVLLIGVNHTVNTSIHYAEKLAGRRQFVRWALTPNGILACPGFPGCSAGFETLAPDLEIFTRKVHAGKAAIQALPLRAIFTVVFERLKRDSKDLICEDIGCERCNEIRYT
jgi:aminoglycoside 3-N-acetyltransferase